MYTYSWEFKKANCISDIQDLPLYLLAILYMSNRRYTLKTMVSNRCILPFFYMCIAITCVVCIILNVDIILYSDKKTKK